jgi:pyridinium-3,5-bisthiocarboxylic acid mononucleotide nickel chelatase
MSTVLHIDPFGGAAGNMLLGALLDLGVPVARLEDLLAGLRLPGWRLEATRTRESGFAGTLVTIVVAEETHPARRLADVEALLAGATLSETVRTKSLAAFHRLFAAEAEAHGVPPAEVHLHELAAVDAVVDIVGVCAAIELLGVTRVTCGPVPVGSGTVATAHGVLPVPPPAVSLLLKGAPLAGHAADGEMTTPTGAALLATLVESFGALPAGRLLRVGVGLGTRRFPGMPNLLRAFVIEEQPRVAGRPMVIVESTLDDVTGETLRALLDRVCEAGATDAWCVPGTGRKGRPLVELRTLGEPQLDGAVVASMFAEGATLGVRLIECARPEIARYEVGVATSFGAIPIKVGVFEGRVVSAKPEHDACVAAARAARVSVAAVKDAVRVAGPRIGAAWETS